MKYLSVSEIAKLWNLSERSVRNYCAEGRVDGAILSGKVWIIPKNAKKPDRKNKKNIMNKSLLDILKEQKETKLKGGIYHKVQIELTYNSNHIEGSKLTHDQTRYIYETNTLLAEKDSICETVDVYKGTEDKTDLVFESSSGAIIEKNNTKNPLLYLIYFLHTLILSFNENNFILVNKSQFFSGGILHKLIRFRIFFIFLNFFLALFFLGNILHRIHRPQLIDPIFQLGIFLLQ